MRFEEGTFSFSPSDQEEGEFSHEVNDVLASARDRLTDWHKIETIVPSLRHTVGPNAQLPSNEVRIGQQEWSTLIAIADGCPVTAVCDVLALGEVDGSRQIKGLAERGLVSISPPKSGSTTYRRANATEELISPEAVAAGAEAMANEGCDPALPGSVMLSAATELIVPGRPAPVERRAERPPTPPKSAAVPAAAAPSEVGTAAKKGKDDKPERERVGGLSMRYFKSDN